MTIALQKVTDVELRSICKERIEALEHWLRRLIDDLLAPTYEDYFVYVDAKGNRLIRGSLSQQVERRRANEPTRYPRKIDAVLLEDAVDIICKPELFRLHFGKPLSEAFPQGREEARTFLAAYLSPETISHMQTRLALGRLNKSSVTRMTSSNPSRTITVSAECNRNSTYL